MSQSLVLAIITISLALVFYTIGVWGEKIQGTLKPIHVIFFWIGFLFDTTGTTIMSSIAKNSSGNPLHAITGVSAILLMLGHAIWATYVIVKKDEKQMASFNKFSIAVWFIWLIPYISGIIIGMSN